MWFDNWEDIARVALVGTASYITLIAILRASGKRTLSQLNAFDFVVTVAIGSTLATILLSAEVSWSEGFVALALLVGLQFIVAAIASRWPRSRALLSAQPSLVLRDGEILTEELSRHRLTTTEVAQAVRASGSGDLSSVAAVVLETDGTLSVIPHETFGDGSALGSMRDRADADQT